MENTNTTYAIRPDLHLNERDGTLLDDGNGSMVAWLRLDDQGNRLEVTWTPANYPALTVNHCTLSDQEIADHINENLVGWHVRRNNLDIAIKMGGEHVVF